MLNQSLVRMPHEFVVPGETALSAARLEQPQAFPTQASPQILKVGRCRVYASDGGHLADDHRR